MISQSRAGRSEPTDRAGERGSALVLAILIAVILTLLGVTFLMIADTENRIAENERRAAQALYVAEAGARAVKRWFDYPGTSLSFPALAELTLTDRRIINETDPYDPAALTIPDGVAIPFYKGQVAADLFQRPYRGSLADALLGTEEFPDIRIDEENHAAYLGTLSNDLLAGFPGGRVEGRISSIEIYAPPYMQLTPGSWTRYGVATIKVIGRIYQDDQILGERMVKAVINEIPYTEAYGPLHSCADLTYNGPLNVHWGVVTASGATDVSNIPADIPLSLPRRLQGVARIDPVWSGGYTSNLDEFTQTADASLIEDPWFRLLSGGVLAGPPPDVAGQQPYPGGWPTWDFGAGQPPPAPCCHDRSSIFQNLPVVTCPDYDYELWKVIAASGGNDVRYFVFDAGSGGFRENGRGVSRTFHDITNGGRGIFFFDTADGQPPREDNGNLTPAITVDLAWTFEGVLYLNAVSFRTGDIGGQATTLNPPGEPFQDLDADGQWDAGEPWVNLDPGNGGTVLYDVAATWDARGTDVVPTRDIAFRGVLYTSGTFVASGTAGYYGSVIARSGVTQTLVPGPNIWWDQSIATGFPPAGLSIPRVFITSWVPTL